MPIADRMLEIAGAAERTAADGPANRSSDEVGGLEKLTPRGVEVCYRLFDRGLSRYAVARAMDISFGAATHRQAAWRKAGGVNRTKNMLR
jgi:DNA-binding NarL/FixJ family response regulator